MTILGHFLQGAFIADLLGASGDFSVGYGVYNTLPDAIPIPDHIKVIREGWGKVPWWRLLFTNEGRDYGHLYHAMHFEVAFGFFAQHFGMDSWMHKDEGWYWYSYLVEIVNDLACVAYFLGRFGWL